MKKTKKTLLTAAMLAASVGTATSKPTFANADYNDLPQPAYGPPMMLGDVNYDGEVDIFDYKEILDKAENYDGIFDYFYDADIDGDIDTYDAESVFEYIIGRSERFQNVEPQDVYGPPIWFETETTTTTVDVTETEIIQTTYGPPMWFESGTTVSVRETWLTQPDYGVMPYFETETHTTTIKPEDE